MRRSMQVAVGLMAGIALTAMAAPAHACQAESTRPVITRALPRPASPAHGTLGRRSLVPGSPNEKRAPLNDRLVRPHSRLDASAGVLG